MASISTALATRSTARNTSAKRLPSIILVLSMYGKSKRDTETDKKKK
jgi:hypothetical protein